MLAGSAKAVLPLGKRKAEQSELDTILDPAEKKKQRRLAKNRATAALSRQAAAPSGLLLVQLWLALAQSTGNRFSRLVLILHRERKKAQLQVLQQRVRTLEQENTSLSHALSMRDAEIRRLKDRAVSKPKGARTRTASGKRNAKRS